MATHQGRGQGRGDRSDKGTQTLEAKNILIATGSEARMLPGLKPDPEFILTNIEILNLTAVPKSLMIIGAGAVGVEFASMFKRFGIAGQHLRDAAAHRAGGRRRGLEGTRARLQEERIRVETGAKCADIQKTGTGVKMKVTLANGKAEDVEAEKLLVAVGRAPNTANIGLENTKVELDRGFIKVNEYQQTGEPGIYAIGDVVAGTPQLAHVATMQGMVAVGAHGRQTGHAGQPQPHSRRDLHRAGHRQRRV